MSKSQIKRYLDVEKKRAVRVRRKIVSDRPRLSVYRSNKYVFAQIIDDGSHKTVAGVRGKDSQDVGKRIAEKAIANGIKEVVFDRSGYKYHGRIKALADSAREAGLKF